MIVVDTTVLVYVLGDLHEFRDPCRRLVKAIERDEVVATTTVEAIQEFAHVRSKRRTREYAVRLSEAYVAMLSPLLVVEEADLRNGLSLFREHRELGSLDAVLAAAAQSIEAPLVSADSAFSVVDNLHHVVPNSKGVDALLGSGK